MVEGQLLDRRYCFFGTELIESRQILCEPQPTFVELLFNGSHRVNEFAEVEFELADVDVSCV